MARDSSGTHTLPAGNPVVSGTAISSTTANNTLSDISAEITDSLSRSGKGPMTAALELANGTVGAPALSFDSDPDCGLYWIGANNVGVAVGGAKVVDVAAAGVGVTGTLAASGVTSLADGAVGTPGLNFTSDPDSGMYRIGANNLGVAVNGAKVLDVATTGLGVTGAVAATGGVSGTSGAFSSHIFLTGSDPLSSTGFSDTITTVSFAKAWALIQITGGGGVGNFTISNLAGLNINTVARTAADTFTVSFSTGFANTNYCPVGNVFVTGAIAVAVGVGNFLLPDIVRTSTTVITVKLRPAADSTVNLDAMAEAADGNITLALHVFGAQ